MPGKSVSLYFVFVNKISPKQTNNHTNKLQNIPKRIFQNVLRKTNQKIYIAVSPLGICNSFKTNARKTKINALTQSEGWFACHKNLHYALRGVPFHSISDVQKKPNCQNWERNLQLYIFRWYLNDIFLTWSRNLINHHQVDTPASYRRVLKR